jgi:multisubunit Na+/H+ antiporter MnhF subunit
MIWIIFAAAAALVAVRAMLGPSFADRVIAFDVIVNLVALLMVFQAIRIQSQLYLDIAIFIVLLSFIGTLAIARYVRKKDWV